MKELKRIFESLIVGCVVALLLFGGGWATDHVVAHFHLWKTPDRDYFEIWCWLTLGSTATFYIYYDSIRKGEGK